MASSAKLLGPLTGGAAQPAFVCRFVQTRDAEKKKAKGKTPPKGSRDTPQPASKGGSRGPPQPASKGSKTEGTGKGSFAKFIKEQKRKR